MNAYSYNSTWQTPMNQSVLNWNITPTKIGFSKSSNSNNYIYASQYSWSAYGKCTSTYRGNKLTSYTIRLNSRTISEDATNFSNFVQSVFVHELGHTIWLGDNPDTTASKDSEKTTVITRADYPYYEDESAIYEKASLVIRGKIIDKRMEYMSQVIELTKEQKDDPQLNPGDVVEIKQFGGETKDTIYIEEGAPQISQNGEYIMFLESYEDSPATLLNNVQSLYGIEDNKIINHVENDFNVTIEKLEKLSNDISSN